MLDRSAVKRLTGAVLAAGTLVLPPLGAELPDEWKPWNEPVEPFRIAGNLYYVGASEIASYLFVTDEGHILLDGGFPETASVIRGSVKQLGFDLADVKILLNSHAHCDHAGGLAELKAITGAELVVARGDAPLLASGGGDFCPFPTAEADRTLEPGERVELGDTTLVATLTAGHTPGCTSWTTSLSEKGESLDTVFVCSVNVLDGMGLLEPEEGFPEGRGAAFERTFDTLGTLPVDIFLGAHASFFLMHDKLEQVRGGSEVNPFIDPELFRRHIEAKRDRFEQELARQMEVARTRGKR